MALASGDAHRYSRSPSFSAARSPDTASPIYPERAIRPLPKSRLKSRLSPEQVSSIKYPPNPAPISPTLNFSTSSNAVDAISNGDASDGVHYHRHEAALVHEHCSCQHGDGESGDEEVEFDHPDYRYATSTLPLATVNSSAGQTYDSVQQRLRDAAKLDGNGSNPVGSATSSADGYESFENTSNKKKRKIPLTSISAAHQHGLSAELANMGIRQGSENDEHVQAASVDRKAHAGPVHESIGAQQNAAGTGISGAGRGRYGRRDAKDGRRPLATTTVNVPNGYAGRPTDANDRKEFDGGLTSPHGATPGIISRAIRAAEAGSLATQKGKENVSLLQQSASASASPKTQFTFTCESDSGHKLLEQQPSSRDSPHERTAQVQATPHYNNAQRGTAAGQRVGQAASNAPVRAPAQAQMPPPPPGHSQQPVNTKPPRPRRSPSKEYALAARQRKIQQQFSNYHHRPQRDDMWICQFCEYEDIFGVPPVALIRAYEIKDRQERKKAAEKRRLLEKAKQRGRKGKKGSKSGANKNNAAAAAVAPSKDQRYDQQGDSMDGGDYFDDDEDGYGDEYDPVGPGGDDADYDTGDYYEQSPPPVPMGTPQPIHSHGVVAG